MLDAHGEPHRQGRGPDRRRRRPLPAGDRPRRRDGRAPDLPALVVGRVVRRGRRARCEPARSTSASSSSGPTRSCSADLLDKQIVDIDGRKVVRVNDLRLDEIEGKLHLVAVDVGAAGLLRRLGIEGAFRTIARNLNLPVPERYIDWEDVDPVETSIASIKLRVPHAGLAELHPADLASIIDQLAPRDRAGILASLDDEAAADAIEEMEPDTQVEVLEDLEPERAADILEEMIPDDAADLVADLSDEARARDPGADGARGGRRGAGAPRLSRRTRPAGS